MHNLFSPSDIETPAVLLDETKLDANLQAMQKLANTHDMALRPHVKTHKSLEIGRRQLNLGATGITVATIDEALVFLNGGVSSITIARPVVSVVKLERLLTAVGAREMDLRLVVDSEEGYRVAAVASGLAKPIGIYVKIDVGLHRCGLLPDDPGLLPLVESIQGDSGLNFLGILSHAGHAYAAPSRAEAAKIAEEERMIMLGVRDSLIAHQIPVQEVSVGATPTVLAATSFEGVTEIRPGNYTFLDLLPVKVGVARTSEVAFSVLATVISKNADYFVTDAGSKTLTSDTGGHGMTGTQGFGKAYPGEQFLSDEHAMTVEKLSEEHGLLRRTSFDLPIGTTVRIIPNHACPVANLAREYLVVGQEGLTAWPVDASKGSR